MTGRIKEDANVRLGLMGRDRCSQSQRVGDSCVEIVHLEVKVHHRALVAVFWWPDRRLISGRRLKDEVDRPLGSRHDGGSRFFVDNRPLQQLRIKAAQRGGVGRFN